MAMIQCSKYYHWVWILSSQPFLLLASHAHIFGYLYRGRFLLESFWFLLGRSYSFYLSPCGLLLQSLTVFSLCLCTSVLEISSWNHSWHVRKLLCLLSKNVTVRFPMVLGLVHYSEIISFLLFWLLKCSFLYKEIGKTNNY